jgi:hypothetical protein
MALILAPAEGKVEEICSLPYGAGERKCAIFRQARAVSRHRNPVS